MQRDKVASRNKLESYVFRQVLTSHLFVNKNINRIFIFSVRQAIEDAGSKLSDSDKRKVQKECDNCIKWLDNNQTAEKDEYEYRFKEIQNICSPIMTKIHKGGRGASGEQGGGPTIEEVDQIMRFASFSIKTILSLSEIMFFLYISVFFPMESIITMKIVSIVLLIYDAWTLLLIF